MKISIERYMELIDQAEYADDHECSLSELADELVTPQELIELLNNYWDIHFDDVSRSS